MDEAAMNTAELVTRHLAGEPLSKLQLECKGSAEDALRTESRVTMQAVESMLRVLQAFTVQLEADREPLLERSEPDAYSRGFDKATMAIGSRAEQAAAHVINYAVSLQMKSRIGLVLRHAEAEDEALLSEWGHAPADFPAMLANPDCMQLVAEVGGKPCGAVRFEQGNRGLGAVLYASVAVVPEELGAPIIADACHKARFEFSDCTCVVAQIKPENTAGIRAFERAGFALHEGEWVLMLPPVPEDEAEDESALTPTELAKKRVDKMHDNTARTRSFETASKFLKSLPRVADLPAATKFGAVLAGSPAFLVCAGPSLSINKHLLQQARHRGTLVVCNSAVPAVVKAGAFCDVVVVIEGFDHSEYLKEYRDHIGLLVCDMSVHPNTWREACERVEAGKQSAWLSLAHPYSLSLMRKLGVVPLDTVGTVATTAFSLARHWGASSVVLVGSDLSYSDDGKQYAEGTPWENVRVETNEKGWLSYSGQEAIDEMRLRSESSACPPERDFMLVDSWDGKGKRRSTWEYVAQMGWYEQQARANPEGRFYNCTEGGAKVPGFTRLGLEFLLYELDNHPPINRWPEPRVSKEAHASVMAGLREEAEDAIDMGREFVGLTGNLDALRGAWRGTPIVDWLIAGEILTVKAGRGDKAYRNWAFYSAYVWGGRALKELVGT